MDAQSAIDTTLDALLPRLISSNESLVAALKRLRDFHLTGPPLPGADAVLAEVEAVSSWALIEAAFPATSPLGSLHPVHLLSVHRAVPHR